MTEEVEYLAKYKPDTLYVNPASSGKGSYATLLAENQFLIDEVAITERIRLAVTVFYVNEKKDISTFKLIKIRFNEHQEWQIDGELKVSKFEITKLKEFISLLTALDLEDAAKTRISLGAAHIDVLDTILRTDSGPEVLKKIAENPSLSEDIFALAHKKLELEVFNKLLTQLGSYKSTYIADHHLNKTGEEDIWQNYFERNPWIFGHGLNYIFLGNDGNKLEVTTTGFSHQSVGNRVDALMKTKAIISQYVLIEIKKPSSDLLQSKEYRSGCWAASSELSGAVSQIQKTVFDFTSNQISKVQVKDKNGMTTGEEIFRVQPKSYLVIGNLSQLKGHDEKFTCFQLFRSSIRNPEILTYDELYERAKCIVETISKSEKI